MKYRCNNSNCPDYKYYGARGINVCKRWDVFKNFLDDMGEKPKGLTINRINGDGNYEPSNCIWSTWKEQSKNRRSHMYKYSKKYNTIGRKLKKLITEKYMFQYIFCKKAGIQGYIMSQILTGRMNPTDDEIQTIKKLLGDGCF
jgi:hypothetical protein